MTDPSSVPGAADAAPGATARLRWLVRNTRVWLLGLVLLLLAIVVASFSFGVFSSSSANPENTFSSGTMSQTSSRDNEAVLSASGMVPGDTVAGTVSITNEGDASGDFTLSATDLVDRPGPQGGNLSEVLLLTIADSTLPDPVYDGPLDEFDSVQLGTWEPGEERTFEFVVNFAEGDNRYAQSSASVTFVWDATQAR